MFYLQEDSRLYSEVHTSLADDKREEKEGTHLRGHPREAGELRCVIDKHKVETSVQKNYS